MAYTNPWSDTSYPGSTQARDIDDKARLTSLAIKERMETFLVKDWEADPVEPQDSLLGTVTGKKLLIGFPAFREEVPSAKAVELNTNYMANFHGSGKIVAPVMLPAGVTLKLIEFLWNRGDVAGIAWRLFLVNFGSPASETLFANNTDTVAGLHVHSQILNHTINENGLYYIDIHSTGGVLTTPSWFLYGVRLTYDTPDSTKTI